MSAAERINASSNRRAPRAFSPLRAGTWEPTAAPATRSGRAECRVDDELRRRDARALLRQLSDYKANWPELAQDFAALHAGDIEAARALLGEAA